jgi:acyl dehydratase
MHDVGSMLHYTPRPPGVGSRTVSGRRTSQPRCRSDDLDRRVAVSSPAMSIATPEVGQTASRTRTVTARDIELFTEITGDRNPLHYDKDAAARSRFGGIIVQGGVTSGLLNAVVAEDLPGPGSVFLSVHWDFRAPVRPGDEITAEVEVLDTRRDKPITTLRTSIVDQDGTVVLDGTAVVYTEPL